MKRNSLGGLYGRLTPEERFRLDVEATVRGDERESQKLVETCPRKTYTAVDYGFLGAVACCQRDHPRAVFGSLPASL